MLLVNFAHPITEAQKAQVEKLAGRAVERILDVKTHFDPALPFAEQATALVESIGLTAAEWQNAGPIVNLPTLTPIAALVLADLHGRMGYFPTSLRLRPVAGATSPTFEVAELLPLQLVRDQARTRR